MSLEIKTDKGNILTEFTDLNSTKEGLTYKSITIGIYEIPIEDFSEMAAHFLTGGWFGWGNNVTPECIQRAIQFIHDMYELKDGKWVRKAETLVS